MRWDGYQRSELFTGEPEGERGCWGGGGGGGGLTQKW